MNVDAVRNALLTFLEGHLSKIEMPREIEFRDELPKTLVGKLSKKELVEEEEKKAGKRRRTVVTVSKNMSMRNPGLAERARCVMISPQS